ncbi:MAG: hypothetical protein R3258_06700 [Acidimicrobiia bacterium]|nr:hypothetical protein [Acidimicrobiia bacterium]
MAEHVDENGMTHAARMGRAIIRGVIVGFPACIIGLTLAVWAITDLDLADSFATAILPGILLGGFAGGFAGVAATME